MDVVGQQVCKWGPVLIRYLPQIIKVGHDIYALWCSIRNNKKQNDTVLKAMQLLNQHQDDIDKLLQDPQQKRALLEGLTILMNRINENNQGQTNFRRDVPPFSFPSPKGATNDDAYYKKSGYSGSTFQDDGACNSKSGYSSSTFQDDGACYSKSGYSSSTFQDDSACYSKSGYNGNSAQSMTFEEQIEYTIALSQREAENHGASYVEERWREVVEAEDEMLAMALQESEIYEASQRCADHYSNAARGHGCCSDGMKLKDCEEDECSKWKCGNEDWRKGEKEPWEDECGKCKCDEDCRKGEKEDKEKHSALLQEEEDLMVQMAMRISLES
ncbi:uncharacterized protein LOC127006957 isoform X1 [Eriocheir sinensis]|uniref:uncharacterized protein LOC127006957 isoform X1 n=1 Tax=Eriocheir sinensis TaxID=95602 RepID=UPI0021C5CDCD|nr:uncharacterized protein LOC127006957 isoform X1 [Eriocheir sinensis]XP_050733327.1 uncharacterized protein LOC127006957 isoform X1 [Eriocheir sinensis]XP_050733328.1 uncharacterized protein LOC127006957 isoform X1 [Eriocheir sinensis]XP_050733329.1 uncharacterized protein LOC127006957 isoform X1 [Eriocheir sinensis]